MSFLLLMNEGRPTPHLLTALSLGNVARLLWAALLLVWSAGLMAGNGSFPWGDHIHYLLA